MLLRKIYIRNTKPAPAFLRGFSLLEVLVVIGILAALGGLSLVFSMESYRGHSFADTQTALVSALHKARAEAMSGMCIGNTCTTGQAYGVHITSTQLVIFQGVAFNANDPLNEYIDIQNKTLTIHGINDIVFAELSGNAAPSGDIILSDTQGHISTTSIGSEGQIVW